MLGIDTLRHSQVDPESRLAGVFSSDHLEQLPVGVAVESLDGRLLCCNPALCRLTGYTPIELAERSLAMLRQDEAESVPQQLAPLTGDGPAASIRECRYTRKDQSRLWVRETVALVRDPLGESAQLLTLVEDISALKAEQQTLLSERAFVKAVVTNVPAGLLACNANGEIVLYNRVAAELFAISGTASSSPQASWSYPLDADVLEPDGVTPMPRDKRPLARTLQGETLKDFEQVIVPPDGTPRSISVSTHRVTTEGGRFIGAVSISQDITERKQSEARFEQLQRSLQDASHAAGMAEIATNVLHNVGNALNGVNVSAGVLAAKLRRTRADGLQRLVGLLDSHQHDLTGFLAAPGKGAQVLTYLRELARDLDAERNEELEEVHSMQRNIDHIKAIVAMQQSYARQSGLAEQADVAELVEDSLRINAGACQRHGVAVSRELEGTPLIVTQRHKVIQILVNLIRNAKYACDASGAEPKRVTLRATRSTLGVQISVQDTGIGIPAANMEHLFTHGFTTKSDGHGFGLHSAALTARELGGTLTASSEGPGLGACFTLDLPLQPPEAGHGT